MKVLQICHKMPFPLHDGGSVSLYQTATSLISVGADVKVLAINTPRNWIDERIIPGEFKTKARFESINVDTRINPISAIRNLFSRQSYFVERFWSEAFNNRLIKVLQQEEFQVVQLEHIYMCLYINSIRQFSKSKIILRPQNIENRVWFRYAELESNPFKKAYLKLSAQRLYKFEKLSLAKVDGILAISEIDTSVIESYSIEKPLITIPIGFDFDKISSFDFEKQYKTFPVFYHLGSMDWLPNIQGINWLIEEVIPLIKYDYPEIEIRLAGKKIPFWLSKIPHCIIDGIVKDAIHYQEDKAVMVVPLLSGGGIRAKIIEGMALGKTIVSTSIGAEGIPYIDGENILIADSPEEFKQKLLWVRDNIDLCTEIGKNAQTLAKQHFNNIDLAQKMMEFYRAVLMS